MISVSEAKNIINSSLIPYDSVQVDFNEAVGHILDQDIVADRDFPPFDRVTMDGIGFSYD